MELDSKMKCYTPISLKRKEGVVHVPCGTCYACLVNRRESWTIRLTEEAKAHLYCFFITLTYSDENLVYANNYTTICKRDVQLFIKKLRKLYTSKIRYYLVGEYGTKTYRPHYHMLLFSETDVNEKDIEKTWKLGNIVIGSVNIKSITYVCKYHVNRGKYPSGSQRPFVLMSKGIGSQYVNKMTAYHRSGGLRTHYQMFEHKKALPRYYKDKIFNNMQKDTINKRVQENISKEGIQEFIEFKQRHPESKNPVYDFYKSKMYNQEHSNATYKEKSNLREKL